MQTFTVRICQRLDETLTYAKARITICQNLVLRMINTSSSQLVSPLLHARCGRFTATICSSRRRQLHLASSPNFVSRLFYGRRLQIPGPQMAISPTFILPTIPTALPTSKLIHLFRTGLQVWSNTCCIS